MRHTTRTDRNTDRHGQLARRRTYRELYELADLIADHRPIAVELLESERRIVRFK